jgi:anti-sigma factor RsiW
MNRLKAWRRDAMTKPRLSEEMLNAFVDGQLSSEDRLRILKTAAADQGLGQEICERQRVKALVHLAYHEPTRPKRPLRTCGIFTWRWWRR